MTIRDTERRFAEGVLGPVIMPPQAISLEELNELTKLVNGLVDPSYLRNSADGKDVVLSEEDRQGLSRLLQETWSEREARKNAYELCGARESEILALRARVKQLEGAIRISIDFGDGHAWWDGEGNAKIEAQGHKLLKETLEAKP